MICPAKINLCLQITGRRADGYHLLDSLVVFSAAADFLRASPAQSLTLSIDGPFAEGLDPGPNNLVLRAARALAAELESGAGATLRLEKHLPVASGIGGGSADAAGALRLLAGLWNAPAHVRARLPAIAAGLGADVPACLISKSLRMRGIGEILDPVSLPRFYLLLVNPGVEVPTGPVFHAFKQQRGNAWSPPLQWPSEINSTKDFITRLAHTANDLEAPAISLCPRIADALNWLRTQPGCRLARMSGSGATCFGLFETEPEIQNPPPLGWWVRKEAVLF